MIPTETLRKFSSLLVTYARRAASESPYEGQHSITLSAAVNCGWQARLAEGSVTARCSLVHLAATVFHTGGRHLKAGAREGQQRFVGKGTEAAVVCWQGHRGSGGVLARKRQRWCAGKEDAAVVCCVLARKRQRWCAGKEDAACGVLATKRQSYRLAAEAPRLVREGTLKDLLYPRLVLVAAACAARPAVRAAATSVPLAQLLLDDI